MNRRDFFAAASAVLALPLVSARAESMRQTQRLIKPNALRHGDTIGIITPSTEVIDPDRLALATHTLKYFGLNPHLGKNVGKRAVTYADSVDARLDDLHELFDDRSVKAVFALRGGYGAGHLLDRIDYSLVRNNPKVFIGYSDITALHLAIYKHAGLVTFHGPVLTSRFTDYTQNSFRKALFDAKSIGKLSNPEESNVLRPQHWLRTIKGGKVTAPLIGGNLSLILAMMGTPYEIDTKGKILFIEDVGEQPYSIDRMLTSLRLAGKLEQAAGIIFGECAGCRPSDYKPSFSSPYSLGEVVDNILGGLKIPVLNGLTIGHTNDQLTLPLGVAATLDADSGVLQINEAAVV